MMLRRPVYKTEDINLGATVAIWRDASEWLAPTRVTMVLPHYLEVVNNGRLKTSGMSRTRLISRNEDAPAPPVCAGEYRNVQSDYRGGIADYDDTIDLGEDFAVCATTPVDKSVEENQDTIEHEPGDSIHVSEDEGANLALIGQETQARIRDVEVRRLQEEAANMAPAISVRLRYS